MEKGSFRRDLRQGKQLGCYCGSVGEGRGLFSLGSRIWDGTDVTD